MAKKWICFILAAVLACSLCACGDKGDDQQKVPYDPTNHEQVAMAFTEALYLRDYATQFSLTYYNARLQREDMYIKDHGSVEAFCEYVQKQAQEKGLDVTINSFDDYYAAYHQVYKNSSYDIYGEYTMTTTIAKSEKLEGDALKKYYDDQIGHMDARYLDGDTLRGLTNAYRVTVRLHVDGEKKDYNENCLIHLVFHEGRWQIVSHSSV